MAWRHGFRWDNGRIVTLDRGPADAALCCSAFDINDRGRVVAVYLDAAGGIKGVLLDRGRASAIAAPGVPMTYSVASTTGAESSVSPSLRTGPDLPAAHLRACLEDLDGDLVAQHDTGPVDLVLLWVQVTATDAAVVGADDDLVGDRPGSGRSTSSGSLLGLRATALIDGSPSAQRAAS